MIECVFTVDYEIYGNGTGALRDLIHDPAQRLASIFRKWNSRFVAFIEAAELEKIEANGTDPAIDLVREQIRELYSQGFELGLHLHPQWCNGRYENGRWVLDYSEYNLCTLGRGRIERIVQAGLDYLRSVVGESGFTPLSFRAGNWLFQPTRTAAAVLAEKGIRLDSSVFKGGLQHNNHLDYRPAMGNGYYWPFSSDVNVPDPKGALLEIPIYTHMVPSWKMVKPKRVSLQKQGASPLQTRSQQLYRILDFLRPWYPLKFDFCRMTLDELTTMIDVVIREDQKSPELYKPVVAIGHTKDLLDLETVDSFLAYLRAKGIKVSTFEGVLQKLLSKEDDSSPCGQNSTRSA